MLKTHKKIIKEVVKEWKNKPNVDAILLYGSLARGTANKDSDVDIEIIHNGRKHYETNEYRYGIKVDFEFWPKKKLEKRIKNHPYLSYPYLEEKILFDKNGFAKKIKSKLKSYFRKNPTALHEWQKWTKEYLTFKKKKTKLSDKQKVLLCKRLYDKLEKKFSKTGKVTRDF